MVSYYITTPIFYVNAKPHLGHAYTSIIADIIARYQQSLGQQVFFLTGTDEHGAKIVRSAEREKVDVKDFVDKHAKLFQGMDKMFQVQPSVFIRTSDKKVHWPGAIKLWKQIQSAGDLYKSTYKGMYCIGHEAFVTEKDLVNGICEDHNSEPEMIEEENYFFRLSKYATQIEDLINSNEFEIIPIARRNEVLAMIRDGIQDISFSRPRSDIEWGIPVPDDDTQTMYVWSDALANYVSALGYGGRESKFKEFWPPDVQIIGKDILRFHAIIWPAMLLSAGLALPKKLYIHGLILSHGKKMSKTLGNVINPVMLGEKYGIDVVRNFLAAEIPSFDDGDMTKERFHEVYTANFANGLGNIVSRLQAMIDQHFSGKIKKPEERLQNSYKIPASELIVSDYITANKRNFTQLIEELNIAEAAGVAWLMLRDADKYIQFYKPFTMVKENSTAASAVLWNASLLLLHSLELLRPIMPDTARNIETMFLGKSESVHNADLMLGKRCDPLFPRLEYET